MKRIGILGSTGSVGSQTLEIIDEYKSEFELVFISGHSNIEKLNNQINKYNPKYACISNDDILDQYNDDVKCKRLYKGNNGLLDLCDIDEVDLVVNAISGYKGLYLSVRLLENNINIALSNSLKGPPEPVSINLSIESLFSPIIHCHRALCSLSTGNIFSSLSLAILINIEPAWTILSLLDKAILILFSNNLTDRYKPL